MRQVRAVASPNDDLILSASRDSTAIPWQRTSSNQFTNPTIFKASSRYVNAVAYLPPLDGASKGVFQMSRAFESVLMCAHRLHCYRWPGYNDQPLLTRDRQAGSRLFTAWPHRQHLRLGYYIRWHYHFRLMGSVRDIALGSRVRGS